VTLLSFVLAAEVIACVPAFYLGFLTLAAVAVWMTRRGQKLKNSPAPGTIAFVIPAHNEELVVGRTIDNLKALDDKDFTINVVADNCSDRTAAICSAAGARVFERFSEKDKSKGHALAWLIPQVIAEHKSSGRELLAVVVVDADGTIDSGSAAAARKWFGAGAKVLQSAYRLERGASSRSRVMSIAFAAINIVRGYGRLALSLPDTLKGNGMWFHASVLERHPWRAFSLAEDLEFGLLLRQAGIFVSFFPEGMATGLPGEGDVASGHQRARWESGRLAIVMKELPGLFRKPLNPGSIDLMMELATPPLSFYVMLLGLLLAGHLIFGVPATIVWLAILCLAFNLLAAVPLAGLPGDAVMDLIGAPFFLAWKLSLLPRIWRDRNSKKWIRTSRDGKN
jgi:cellulose synthase/poly-beta-1,6-N-acetylglucosamine synthase-like glycosyltransferase